jgi:hypothetical protein
VSTCSCSTLRHRPHPHFSLSEALATARTAADAGSLTSATTSALGDHASLPPHVQLAYDGLSVDFSVD